MSDEIEFAKFPVIMAPFFGALLPIKVRELTAAQIQSCGNFSLIETFEDKIYNDSKNATLKEMYAYSERHHNIAKNSLVSPSYDEIMQVISKDDKVKKAEEKIKEIESKIHQIPSGPKRSQLEKDLTKYKMWAYMLLPDNFLSFIVSYALGVNKSDIKKVSEEMLLEAAILATKGHDNPSDHVHGLFTDFNKEDINKRAWFVYSNWKNEKKRNR